MVWWGKFEQSIDIKAGESLIDNTIGLMLQEGTESTKLSKLQYKFLNTDRRSLFLRTKNHAVLQGSMPNISRYHAQTEGYTK